MTGRGWGPGSPALQTAAAGTLTVTAPRSVPPGSAPWDVPWAGRGELSGRQCLGRGWGPRLSLVAFKAGSPGRDHFKAATVKSRHTPE